MIIMIDDIIKNKLEVKPIVDWGDDEIILGWDVFYPKTGFWHTGTTLQEAIEKALTSKLEVIYHG